MNIKKWLDSTARALSAAGIATARLDALVLLEDCLGQDRAWILARPEAKLTDEQVKQLQKLLTRRATHEPLAYIRERTEFYGRNFGITADVLEPRPESETIIDHLKLLSKSGLKAYNHSDSTARLRIADVGTGSGALGITAKLELPEASVDLLDIDTKALDVARINVDKFTIQVKISRSDLLANSNKDYDILLCNLPYVPDDFQINTAATHEPRIAIFGGSDGLNLYRRLFQQVSELTKQPLYILCESLPTQHNALEKIATAHGYACDQTDDFIQIFTLDKS